MREDEYADSEFGAGNKDEQFVIPDGVEDLIDGAVRLASKLRELPRCSQDQRITLEKALFALQQLPRATPELAVEFGFSFEDARGDLHYWVVHFDETELRWSAGGYAHGPAGGDSYTSFNFSLWRGGEDSPIGSPSYWLDWECDFPLAMSISVNDYTPEPDTPNTDMLNTPDVARPIR